MIQSNQNKLIVIGGPTASGKTSLAIKLAQHFDTEILSADSRQCYKELDIGVAKPNKKELEQVTHYFINSHSIHTEVTAGTYMRYGIDVLERIFQKNKVAICVGGTGLYIKALCEGLDAIPPVNKEIRESLEAEFENKGLEWLQKEVQKYDLAFYEQVDTNNYMRLLRALTFYKSHNQSILNFTGLQKEKRPFDIEYYAIDMNRETLYERIDKRVDGMMEDGLFEEVQSLKVHENIKALQTVGYKELLAHMNGEMSLEKSVDKIKQHSRNYAKRQLTWFKNQGAYNVLSAEQIALTVESTSCR